MSARDRILVVDDDPVNVKIIQESFQNRFDLKIATTGEEALVVASQFKPDLVLLDIMMPGIDGYETCKKIKENPDLKFTKVLMVSAKTMVKERLTGYGSGADDYITKPFNDDELIAKVKVYLNLKFIEEFNDFKSNVMQLISREIRTPLSSVMGSLKYLNQDKHIHILDTKVNVEQIIQSCQKISSLCDEALLLCELKEGKKVVQEEVVLSELINDIIATFADKIREKNLRVGFKSETREPVWVDKALIRKSLEVILQNSITYSHPKGEINIAGQNNDGELVISVSDQGKGIAGRFFHEISNSEDKKDQAGEGIGFAIAKIATRLNGGELIHKPNDPVGVTFLFRLPLKARVA